LISFKRQALLSIHKRRKMLIIRPWLHVKWFLEDTFQHPLIDKNNIVLAANKVALDEGAKVGDYCWNKFGERTFLSKKDIKKFEENQDLLGLACEFCQAKKMFEIKKTINLPELKVAGKIMDAYWIPISEDKYLCSMIDITERKLYESQLAHTQKMESIGRLAAGIAHEINTPAQYVGDNISFLRDSFNDLNKMFDVLKRMQGQMEESEQTPRIVDELGAIAEEIDFEYLLDEIPVSISQSQDGIAKVSKIVQAMKEFSHPGGQSKSKVDLNRAIENTVTVSCNEWKYVAEVKTDYDKTLPEVPCFPDQFNQVVLNMIINSVHAIEDSIKGSDAKGTITIQTRYEEQMAEIRISDTGTGIPENAINKIFDPFFTSKEVGKGTGQGLSISHDMIVTNHGGIIDVESVPGQGTTFIIQLPLS